MKTIAKGSEVRGLSIPVIPVLVVIPIGARPPSLRELSSKASLVRIVHSAAELRSALRATSGFRVVISAATLPDGNWLSVLREIVHCSARAELVVLAGVKDDPDFRLRVMSYGAFDVVDQGIDRDGLWETVVRASRHAEQFAFEIAVDSAEAGA